MPSISWDRLAPNLSPPFKEPLVLDPCDWLGLVVAVQC